MLLLRLRNGMERRDVASESQSQWMNNLNAHITTDADTLHLDMDMDDNDAHNDMNADENSRSATTMSSSMSMTYAIQYGCKRRKSFTNNDVS